jgi:uncharacterized protein YpmB
MKKSIIAFLLVYFIVNIMTSCDNNKVKKSEYDKLQQELAETKKANEELQKTPQIRLSKGQDYIVKNDFEKAKKELSVLVEKFKGSIEAKKAESLLAEIEKKEKLKKETEERKKALGFKILKENTTLNIDNITLKFKSVSTGSKWIFENDKYDYYSYRSAERGNSFVLAKVIISSKVKKSSIPLISVYKLSNGCLNLVGNMRREFVTDTEGSYNEIDFKYVSNVAFSQALEISKKTLEETAVFVVVKKVNCSKYKFGYYLDTNSEDCKIKSTLTVDDFDKNYVLIKILNKKKLL